MLPHGDCSADDLPLCCTQLFGLADEIREVAYSAVQNCINQSGLECLTPLRTYVSIDEPSDPLSDYVVSWTGNMIPEGAFNPADKFSFSGGRSTITVNVRLLETGYPVPRVEGAGDDTRIVVPDPRQVLIAAEHSYSHGEAMFRALAGWVNRNNCDARMVQFQPAERSGGSVGWEAQIAVIQAFDR